MNTQDILNLSDLPGWLIANDIAIDNGHNAMISALLSKLAEPVLPMGMLAEERKHMHKTSVEERMQQKQNAKKYGRSPYGQSQHRKGVKCYDKGEGDYLDWLSPKWRYMEASNKRHNLNPCHIDPEEDAPEAVYDWHADYDDEAEYRQFNQPYDWQMLIAKIEAMHAYALAITHESEFKDKLKELYAGVEFCNSEILKLVAIRQQIEALSMNEHTSAMHSNCVYAIEAQQELRHKLNGDITKYQLWLKHAKQDAIEANYMIETLNPQPTTMAVLFN